MRLTIWFVSEEEKRRKEKLARDENNLIWILTGLDYCEGGVGHAKLKIDNLVHGTCYRNADLSGYIQFPPDDNGKIRNYFCYLETHLKEGKESWT